MPFQKQVNDGKILEQFEREDIARNGYTYAEIAENITDISAEAVRQRLVKMDGEKVESTKVGGVRLWHLPGVDVFSDGGAGPASYSIPGITNNDIGRFHFDAAVLAVVGWSILGGIMLVSGMAVEHFGSMYGVPPAVRYLLVGVLAVVFSLILLKAPTLMPGLGKWNPMEANR